MSDITKMNLIAIVQQLPEEDIEFIQTCITMLEDKIEKLKQTISEQQERIEIYESQLTQLKENNNESN